MIAVKKSQSSTVAIDDSDDDDDDQDDYKEPSTNDSDAKLDYLGFIIEKLATENCGYFPEKEEKFALDLVKRIKDKKHKKYIKNNDEEDNDDDEKEDKGKEMDPLTRTLNKRYRGNQ